MRIPFPGFSFFLRPHLTRNMSNINTLTQKVLVYIQEHPGCTRMHILDTLPRGTRPSTVSNMMGRLQRAGLVENRGGFAQYAKWYPVQSEIDEAYLDMARDILTNMAKIHPLHRHEYLAQQLQEIAK